MGCEGGSHVEGPVRVAREVEGQPLQARAQAVPANNDDLFQPALSSKLQYLDDMGFLDLFAGCCGTRHKDPVRPDISCSSLEPFLLALRPSSR